MFMKYAQAFIALPGGFGTLDEVMEAITLIQTGKSERFPVILLGKSYWGGYTAGSMRACAGKRAISIQTILNLFIWKIALKRL